MRDGMVGMKRAVAMFKQGYQILPVLTLLSLFGVPVVQGEDALRPRTHGDWSHDNAPIPTYRDCHPALTECQLPVTPVTKGSSTLNERAVSGKELGAPGVPVPLDDRGTLGPDIGNNHSSNKDDALSGTPGAH